MTILSDDEIKTIADKTQTAEPGTDGYILPFSFANEIIAATVAKLAQGVSVEPVHHIMSDGAAIGYYSHDQLQTAIAAAHLAGRKSVHDSCVDLWKDDFLAAALEEAAKLCNSMGKHQNPYDCADAIRALIGKETT
jgi:hypothetical protein